MPVAFILGLGGQQQNTCSVASWENRAYILAPAVPVAFGSHKAFLSNLTSGWPNWPLHDLWPSNALHFGQGFFLPNINV